MSATFQPVRSGPAAQPAAAPMDLIFIEGFVAETVIGIHDDELHDTQPVRVDLQAGVPRARACDTDRIHDTIDYGVVRGRLVQLFAAHRVQLLEALAETIAAMLVLEFGAHWVRVAVAKPRKFRDVESVGVVIERGAEEVRAAHAVQVSHAAHSRDRGGAVLSLIGAGMVPQKS